MYLYVKFLFNVGFGKNHDTILLLAALKYKIETITDRILP